jgi:hypothetical protein
MEIQYLSYMKNSKGAIVVVLVLVLAAMLPVLWDRITGKKSNSQTAVAHVDEKEICSGGPSALAHGEPVEWGSSDGYPKKGKTVTFEGYVEMPNLTYLNGGTYMVNLLQDSTSDGRKIVLQVMEGDCENTMLPIPTDYETSDLLIYDNDGNEIVQGDKIRVTGKVRDDGALYMIFAKRVEKI